MDRSWLRYVRRGVGVGLVLLVVLPVFRLLHGREIGVIGADILGSAERAYDMLLFGTIIVVPVAVVMARVVSESTVDRWTTRISRALTGSSALQYAVLMAVLAFALTTMFSLLVLDGKPNLVDAMAQLVQARYVAEGHLTGPVGVWSPFIALQNTLVVPEGWVSKYPPGYVVLLAAGLRVGAAWLVGPLLMAITVFFTSLAAERLLSNQLGVARLGALFVAISPFSVGLAGAYMNHVGAAAGIAAAVYCALRAAEQDRLSWAVLVGVALGFTFTIRPVAAVWGGILLLVVWLSRVGADGNVSPAPLPVPVLIRRLVAAFAGAVPFGLAIALYNARLFGHPLRFGYVAADGVAVGLGFHRDPWGNFYGPLEALAYTSSDLTALSLNLLETPIPAVVICGLYLILAPRLNAGVRVIAAWALLPVIAGSLYWHHGIFMGPRMLNEAAPAWALLAAVSGVGLVNLISPTRMIGAYNVRLATTLVLTLGLVMGLVYLAPQRLLSYGGPYMASTRIAPPQTKEPSLIFVHGGWTGRLAMPLIAMGMPLDSVETLFRQNPTCAVDRFAKSYVQASPAERRALVATMDFAPRSGDPLIRVESSPGSIIRVQRGEKLTEPCLKEFFADRLGIVDVSPFLWQRDLPGLEAKGAMLVRDLGPTANEVVMRAFPDRRPFFLYRSAPSTPATVMDYQTGMASVWGFPQ